MCSTASLCWLFTGCVPSLWSCDCISDRPAQSLLILDKWTPDNKKQRLLRPEKQGQAVGTQTSAISLSLNPIHWFLLSWQHPIIDSGLPQILDPVTTHPGFLYTF